MKWKERAQIWLDHRTGIETAVRNFLYEEIPASSGWHQVLGSVALFLFLTQVFTGDLAGLELRAHCPARPTTASATL